MNLPTNPRYKYRLIALLKSLDDNEYEIAMKHLPVQLKIAPRTWKSWLYIKHDAKHEIPGRALVELAHYFQVEPREMFTETLEQSKIKVTPPDIMKLVVKWFLENGVAIGYVEFTPIGDVKTLMPRTEEGAAKVIESAPVIILTLLGFMIWDEAEGILLFPAGADKSWLEIIPQGYEVCNSAGESFPFDPAREYEVMPHGCYNLGFVRPQLLSL